jgi:hypothetical protein
MTVYIEKPAVNLREELASLRNQGVYQEQQFWFDGLVTNGTFDTNTSGWTGSGATLSVSSGALVITLTGTYGQAYQAINTVAGKTYVATADLTAETASGGIYLGAGTTATGTQLALSSNTVAGNQAVITFVATGTTTYINMNVNGSASQTATFDNVSVFETDGTDVVHRMPKGWKPKDVFEDGLLQREGAAYDYEVVYDSFDYYVKPAVAPSATTQTCVIGVKA